VPRKRSTSPGAAPERLTALYHQLQGVIPLLQDLVQPGDIKEGAARSTSGSSLSPEAGPRYRFEKRGKASWTVLDRRQGDALLALTKYKKGTETLIERLEAYERYIAHLAAVHATPHQAPTSDRSAFPAPP
jgi:hypothetical protein